MKISASPSGHVPPTRLLAVFTAPIQRAADDVPAWGRVAAPVAGVGQFLMGYPFPAGVLILLACGLADYVVGVKAARYAGTYKPALAHAGVMTKTVGLLLVLLLRATEAWVGTFGLGSTRGALAITVTVWLVAADIDSLLDHYATFGGKPIGVISRILAFWRSAAAAQVPSHRPPPPPDGAP